MFSDLFHPVRSACSAALCVALSFVPSLAVPSTCRAEEVELKRFEKTVICGELTQPMELETAPDGRIFLIELIGHLKVIDPVTGKQEIVGKLEVTTAQENGLIGLALDPKFVENGWIYLQYSPPNYSGQQVSRFEFRDNRLVLESEKVLFKYEEQRRECCHHAGSMEFGPDGNLYIGTGDNTNPFNDSQGYAPLDEREKREPWDAQRTAGNTKSYNGKVLRIHPETDGSYSIPDGNLFPKDGSIGHPEIFVMGCRNPWRISVDAKTGFLYWGDVGPDAGQENNRGPRGYDEINQARAAGNFGWPYFIGNNFAYSMVNFANGEIQSAQDPAHPFNRSINNTGAQNLPPAQPAMIYYPSSTSQEFPALESGGRTACAGPVYYFDEQNKSTTKFPAAYDRTLFAFEWSRNAVYAVHLDEDSRFKSVERFLPQMPFIRPADIVFDAAGSMLMIEYGETWGVNPDARVVRIDYVRGNRRPQAIAKGENTVGREPLQVTLNADGSSDKDGDALQYRWTAVPSGSTTAERINLGSERELHATFEKPGLFTVELEVVDPSGARDVTSLPIIVGNSRPQVEFASPAEGDFFSPGEPVPYRVVVHDVEDGTSDVAQAESGERELIRPEAGLRVFTESIPVASGDAAKDAAPGLVLMRKSDCFNCHAADRTLVGPSLVDIAKKYRDQPHQVEVTVNRVMQGSTGVWGKVGMLPHGQHTPAEVRSMVEYVFSVTAGTSNPTAVGFKNSIVVQKIGSNIRLEATYTDGGRDELPKLVGTASVQLRNPHLQAEDADEISKVQRLGSGSAEGKQFVGAIEHDGYLKVRSVPLSGVRSVAVSVASAGAGGTIELHTDKPDGPLVGSIPVEVNGQWEKFSTKTIELTPTEGKADLFVVFKNEANRGGLMNIDWLEFRKTDAPQPEASK
ncbi:MAG: PQQ-dependent sugar dehydrogenase [Pirellulales bacterium]